MDTTEDSDASEGKRSMTNGSSEENEDENVNESEEDKKPRMFSFHAINSYGNAEVDKITDDDTPIKLSSKLLWNVDKLVLLYIYW